MAAQDRCSEGQAAGAQGTGQTWAQTLSFSGLRDPALRQPWLSRSEVTAAGWGHWNSSMSYMCWVCHARWGFGVMLVAPGGEGRTWMEPALGLRQNPAPGCSRDTGLSGAGAGAHVP